MEATTSTTADLRASADESEGSERPAEDEQNDALIRHPARVIGNSMELPMKTQLLCKAQKIQGSLERSLGDVAKNKIMHILSDINELSDVEKLLLYLKLPDHSPYTDKDGERRTKDQPSEVGTCVAWVTSHLQQDVDISLPKLEVYDDYRDYCDRHGYKQVTPMDFVKLVRQAFPKVKLRRLGQRGHSKPCFGGLKKKHGRKTFALPQISKLDDQVLDCGELRGDDDEAAGESSGAAGDGELREAACSLVCEWAQKLLSKDICSMPDLAKCLLNKGVVSSHSAAAFTVIAACPARHKKQPGPAWSVCTAAAPSDGQALVPAMNRKPEAPIVAAFSPGKLSAASSSGASSMVMSPAASSAAAVVTSPAPAVTAGLALGGGSGLPAGLALGGSSGLTAGAALGGGSGLMAGVTLGGSSGLMAGAALGCGSGLTAGVTLGGGSGLMAGAALGGGSGLTAGVTLGGGSGLTAVAALGGSSGLTAAVGGGTKKLDVRAQLQRKLQEKGILREQKRWMEEQSNAAAATGGAGASKKQRCATKWPNNAASEPRKHVDTTAVATAQETARKQERERIKEDAKKLMSDFKVQPILPKISPVKPITITAKPVGPNSAGFTSASQGFEVAKFDVSHTASASGGTISSPSASQPHAQPVLFFQPPAAFSSSQMTATGFSSSSSSSQCAGGSVKPTPVFILPSIASQSSASQSQPSQAPAAAIALADSPGGAVRLPQTSAELVMAANGMSLASQGQQQQQQQQQQLNISPASKVSSSTSVTALKQLSRAISCPANTSANPSVHTSLPPMQQNLSALLQQGGNLEAVGCGVNGGASMVSFIQQPSRSVTAEEASLVDPVVCAGCPVDAGVAADNDSLTSWVSMGGDSSNDAILRTCLDDTLLLGRYGQPADLDTKRLYTDRAAAVLSPSTTSAPAKDNIPAAIVWSNAGNSVIDDANRTSAVIQTNQSCAIFVNSAGGSVNSPCISTSLPPKVTQGSVAVPGRDSTGKPKLAGKTVSKLLKETRGFGPLPDPKMYVHDRRPVAQLLKESRRRSEGRRSQDHCEASNKQLCTQDLATIPGAANTTNSLVLQALPVGGQPSSALRVANSSAANTFSLKQNAPVITKTCSMPIICDVTGTASHNQAQPDCTAGHLYPLVSQSGEQLHNITPQHVRSRVVGPTGLFPTSVPNSPTQVYTKQQHSAAQQQQQLQQQQQQQLGAGASQWTEAVGRNKRAVQPGKAGPQAVGLRSSSSSSCPASPFNSGNDSCSLLPNNGFPQLSDSRRMLRPDVNYSYASTNGSGLAPGNGLGMVASSCADNSGVAVTSSTLTSKCLVENHPMLSQALGTELHRGLVSLVSSEATGQTARPGRNDNKLLRHYLLSQDADGKVGDGSLGSSAEAAKSDIGASAACNVANLSNICNRKSDLKCGSSGKGTGKQVKVSSLENDALLEYYLGSGVVPDLADISPSLMPIVSSQDVQTLTEVEGDVPCARACSQNLMEEALVAANPILGPVDLPLPVGAPDLTSAGSQASHKTFMSPPGVQRRLYHVGDMDQQTNMCCAADKGMGSLTSEIPFSSDQQQTAASALGSRAHAIFVLNSSADLATAMSGSAELPTMQQRLLLAGNPSRWSVVAAPCTGADTHQSPSPVHSVLMNRSVSSTSSVMLSPQSKNNTIGVVRGGDSSNAFMPIQGNSVMEGLVSPVRPTVMMAQRNTLNSATHPEGPQHAMQSFALSSQNNIMQPQAGYFVPYTSSARSIGSVNHANSMLQQQSASTNADFVPASSIKPVKRGSCSGGPKNSKRMRHRSAQDTYRTMGTDFMNRSLTQLLPHQQLQNPLVRSNAQSTLSLSVSQNSNDSGCIEPEYPFSPEIENIMLGGGGGQEDSCVMDPLMTSGADLTSCAFRSQSVPIQQQESMHVEFQSSPFEQQLDAAMEQFSTTEIANLLRDKLQQDCSETGQGNPMLAANTAGGMDCRARKNLNEILMRGAGDEDDAVNKTSGIVRGDHLISGASIRPTHHLNERQQHLLLAVQAIRRMQRAASYPREVVPTPPSSQNPTPDYSNEMSAVSDQGHTYTMDHQAGGLPLISSAMDTPNSLDPYHTQDGAGGPTQEDVRDPLLSTGYEETSGIVAGQHMEAVPMEWIL